MKIQNFINPHEYFHLIFQVFFKIRTLKIQIKDWNKKQLVKYLIFANFYTFLLSILIMLIIEILCLRFGFNFKISGINGALFYVTFGVIFGIVFGLILGIVGDLTEGLVGGVALGVVFGVAFGIAGGLAGRIALGMAFGVALSVVGGVAGGVAESMVGGVALGVALGLAGGVIGGVALGVALSVAGGLTLGIIGSIIFTISFFLVWARWFYLPFFLFAVIKKIGPEKLPSHWDENIFVPFPFLSFFLINLARNNKKFVIKEASFLIRERSPQRKAAQKTLAKIALDEMLKFRNIHNIADIKNELNFLPKNKEAFPEFYQKGYSEIYKFSEDAQKAITEINISNRLQILEKLLEDIQEFQKKMNFSKSNIGVPFGRIAGRWFEIIQKETEQIEKDCGRSLPNPFIVGNPIQPGSEMFVGRNDIIEQIQRESLREGGASSILFIGNRRTGKTSTLFNLTRFLISSLKPVYIDLQDPRAFSSEEQFSRVIIHAVKNALKDSDVILETNISLANLTEYLEKIQKELSEKKQHLLLCFDEYEKVAPKIANGILSNVPDAFRYWIQHFPNIICLFAGSYHPDKIKEVDWSDYLINVRLVPISFLDFESAYKLVTKPIPRFELQYIPDNRIAENLVYRLGCHPFLIQSTMSQLIDYLNHVNKKIATQEDLNIAVNKMMIASTMYFKHFWGTELNETERKLLLFLIKVKKLFKNHKKTINSLIKKEILFDRDGKYLFCVPVFKEWIVKQDLTDSP